MLLVMRHQLLLSECNILFLVTRTFAHASHSVSAKTKKTLVIIILLILFEIYEQTIKFWRHLILTFDLEKLYFRRDKNYFVAV